MTEPSTKDKVSLLDAGVTKYFAEILKNRSVLLTGATYRRLFYMKAAIIELAFMEQVNEQEIVRDKTLSTVILLMGFAAGLVTSKEKQGR